MAKYKKIAISSGHALHVRGASGYIDEVDEARKVVKKVTTLLKNSGCTVSEIHDDVSKTKAQNITNGRSSYLVKKHNGSSREIDVSVHFNACKKTTSPVGVEVLYKHDNMKAIASGVSKAIADAGGFKNRGAKKRTDLAFLNSVNKPSILLEVCFVDSKADTDLYKKHFTKICEAIAKALCGKSPSTTTKPSSSTTVDIPKGTVKVVCDALNVRSKADFGSALASGTNPVKKGSTHTVYEKKNGLYRIGKNRWVSANEKYVKYTVKKDVFKVGTYQKDVITTADLNARAGRGTQHAINGTFKKGARVNVWYIDKAKDGSLWGSCSINGKTSYIHMGYVVSV